MNNDRELLEQAAKAAGELTPDWYGNNAYFDGVLKRWNPLTDDGDALRLAVKLGLEVSIGAVGRHPETGEVFGMTYVTSADYDCLEKHSDDPYAATRRAIVRAAAEIGKGMK